MVKTLKSCSRGFTLIEMLLVMAIVALLLSLVAPRYFASLDKAKDVGLAENLKVIRVTLDRYYADKGHFPETLEELVENKYLRRVPVDPITESDQTWQLQPATDPNVKGIADVKSGAQGKANDGRDYGSF